MHACSCLACTSVRPPAQVSNFSISCSFLCFYAPNMGSSSKLSLSGVRLLEGVWWRRRKRRETVAAIRPGLQAYRETVAAIRLGLQVSPFPRVLQEEITKGDGGNMHVTALVFNDGFFVRWKFSQGLCLMRNCPNTIKDIQKQRG